METAIVKLCNFFCVRDRSGKPTGKWSETELCEDLQRIARPSFALNLIEKRIVVNEGTPKLYKIGNCNSENNHRNFSNIEFVSFATFKNNCR